MSRKVLIIDDEADIRKLVSAYLEKEGYQVYQTGDGTSAIQSARSFKPDLILLDIMLPGQSGLEILSSLRRESDIYIIMMTAKSEEVDKIVGLNMGADDYITKPFSPRELVARVNAALRRFSITEKNTNHQVLQFQHVRLDSGSRQVWVDEELLDLTASEFEILYHLMARSGQVLSREQILAQVWDEDYYGDTRVVDVHIGHIRKKLGGQFITTVWGVGYRFNDEPLI